MSSKNFLQFEFETHSQDELEKLVALLSEQGFDGFIEEEMFLSAFVLESRFVQKEFEETLEKFSILAYTMSEVENINWNQRWEQEFHPVIVDHFAGIRAHFHQPLKNIQHEIIITPKMSFGTGHHATTHMMIQLMKDINFKEKVVLDFGTGTGVLAILAEKLGAASVIAIDNDDWSIENARENAEKNSMQNILVQLADQVPEQQFDIILANINLSVILASLDAIYKACKPGAFLMLSGFLRSDKGKILDAVVHYKLLNINFLEKGEWLALVCENNC